MGMIPLRLTRPIVGFTPTSPLTEEGQTIEPSVSVPTATAPKLAAIAAPEPELEPHGVRSRTYGFRVWPPRPLQPLDERVERKLAHSLRLVLPSRMAPASRRRAAMKASRGAGAVASAREPAVVSMRSPVSTLSFSRTGMPCSGPRELPAAPLGVHPIGDVERVGIDLEDAADRRPALVHGADAADVGLGDRARRVAAGGHAGLEVGDGGLLEGELLLGGGHQAGRRRAGLRTHDGQGVGRTGHDERGGAQGTGAEELAAIHGERTEDGVYGPRRRCHWSATWDFAARSKRPRAHTGGLRRRSLPASPSV